MENNYIENNKIGINSPKQHLKLEYVAKKKDLYGIYLNENEVIKIYSPE